MQQQDEKVSYCFFMHSPGWFGHMRPCCDYSCVINSDCLAWRKSIYCSFAQLFLFTAFFSELPSLNNMCFPGCIIALQAYVSLACPLCVEIMWRFPSFPSLLHQSPRSSLSIQELPSPTALHVCCLPFPLSAPSLFALLSPYLHGWNKPLSCKQQKTPFQMDHIPEHCFSLGNVNCEKRPLNACAFFHTYPLDGHHSNKWSDKTWSHNNSVCIKMRFKNIYIYL